MSLSHDEFIGLLHQNENIIHKICRVYCVALAEREDLAQEIIYHLWKAAKSFDNTYKFSTWMYRVALNVAISHYRNNKKNVLATPLGDHHLNKAEPTFDEQEEQVEELYVFIESLPVLDRALILLYLEGKSYKEIASVMGISVTNTGTKINRLKDKLKKHLLTKHKTNG